MARQNSRSLKLSTKGIEKANIALKKYASQTALALEVFSKRSKGKSKKSVSGMSRTTIGNFLNGRIVQRKEFHEICDALGLKFEEVVELPTSDTNIPAKLALSTQIDEIDVLVKNIRDALRPRVLENHGKIKVLDTEQPINLNDIYIDINILEKVSGPRLIDHVKLREENQYDEDNFNYGDLTIEIHTPKYPNDVERFNYGSIKPKPSSGLKKVSDCQKLLLMGRPGSGKTTFLKYLTIQCIREEFQTHCIPVFITLKRFAESKGQPNLLEYIHKLIETKKMEYLEHLLHNGRILILLDGLDKVFSPDKSRVLEEIESFSELYFKNRFVVTSSDAAFEHNLNLFTQAKIDDFNEKQIIAFTKRWFRQKENEDIATDFWEKLKINTQIKELAKTPQLLALLCLIFGESGKFPDKRSDLYRHVTKMLFQKDIIDRNDKLFYNKLLLNQKEKLFSYIAYSTFGKENYLFDIDCANDLVKNFLLKFPDLNTDQLEIDKFMSIVESQNGLIIGRAHEVYSFSHLTFHEYFTAREIIESNDGEALLINLAEKIFESRWKEVFLIVSEMLLDSGRFFLHIKYTIDRSIIKELDIQKFINWVYQRSSRDDGNYKKVSIRALYWKFLGYGYYAEEIANAFDAKYSCFYNLDHILIFILNRARALNIQSLWDLFAECNIPDRSRVVFSGELIQALDTAIAWICNLNADLWSTLQKLREQLLESTVSEIEWQQWWQTNGITWETELKDTLFLYLDIDIHTALNEAQKELLIRYLEANFLLVNCLNKSPDLNPLVREEIEDTLLLPIAEIERRKVARIADTPSPS